MKKKIQSVVRKVWAVTFLFPLVASAQFTKPGNTGLPTGTIFNIIKGIMNWLLGILGFVAVIGFVVSGIMFLIAAGDEDRQKTAKKAMFYSITGVIVGLVGYVALLAIEAMLNASSATF